MHIFSQTIQDLYKRFLVYSRGPEGFRELREAGRNHFHISWYLLMPGIMSYDQKPLRELFRPDTVCLISYFLFNLFRGSYKGPFETKSRNEITMFKKHKQRENTLAVIFKKNVNNNKKHISGLTFGAFLGGRKVKKQAVRRRRRPRRSFRKKL